MTIIKRADLGRPLTWDELDNNFSQVDSLVGQAATAVNTATTQAAAASSAASDAAQSSQDAQDAASTAGSAAASAVAGIYSDFASTDESKGASLVKLKTGRTVQSKLTDFVTPLDYLAVGNGITNDSAAFTALEVDHNGKTINLCGLTYVVNSYPSGNTYVNGKFLISGVTYQADQNSGSISDLTDTGGLLAAYTGGVNNTPTTTGRSTKNLYGLYVSQNCRSQGPARAVNVGSIYSWAYGNLSGNYTSRQSVAGAPQTVNHGSEECEAYGFQSGNYSSHYCSAEYQGATLTSRYSSSSAIHAVTVGTESSHAGGGYGARFTVSVNGSGVVTDVTILSGGLGYSSGAGADFRDRLGQGTGAAATLTVDGSGTITAVTLTNGGTTYSTSVDLCIHDTGDYSAIVASIAGSFTYGPASAVIASYACTTMGAAAYSLVAASRSAVASNTYSVILGANTATATGANSVVLGGSGNATADSAMVLGGILCDATAIGASVLGRRTVNNVARSMAGGDGSSGSASSANRKWSISHTTGQLSLASTVLINQTFTDVAKMFENVEAIEIPVGSLIAWEGRKVRLAVEGDVNFSVQSSTPAMILGDSQFTWAERELRDEFGRVVYHEIPDPDWEPLIPDPDWSPKIKNPLHPVYDLLPLYDEKGEETGHFTRVIASEEFIPNPNEPDMIENPQPAQMVSVPMENPDYDPEQPQIPRSERSDEWTAVALIGEVHTRVDASVNVDDFIKPSSVDGVGTVSENTTHIRCMEIRQDYDAEKGFAIALCLVWR